jgi:hypothetical protein
MDHLPSKERDNRKSDSHLSLKFLIPSSSGLSGRPGWDSFLNDGTQQVAVNESDASFASSKMKSIQTDRKKTKNEIIS